MLIAITGTPGIGKTSVSKILRKNGYEVVDLNKLATDQDFIISEDKKRNSKIVDIDKLDKFLKGNFCKQNLVFIEGHLSHLLKSIDKVILLRCHPKELKKRLKAKKWNKAKIKENIESEILDIILCESSDLHKSQNIFEIDTTKLSKSIVASCILEIITKDFKNIKKYNMGQIDWSEEIFKDF